MCLMAGIKFLDSSHEPKISDLNKVFVIGVSACLIVDLGSPKLLGDVVDESLVIMQNICLVKLEIFVGLMHHHFLFVLLLHDALQALVDCVLGIDLGRFAASLVGHSHGSAVIYQNNVHLLKIPSLA